MRASERWYAISDAFLLHSGWDVSLLPALPLESIAGLLLCDMDRGASWWHLCSSVEESHEPQPGPMVSATLRVAAADLRWCCDEACLPFVSTDEVEPLTGVMGQDDAIEALRFGLEITGPGQHIFVRGLTSTSGISLVRQLLDDSRPTCPLVDDRCYVHNFAQPDHLRLLTVPRSQAGPC